MPRSRRRDIRQIAGLIGNAAVHVALYPGQYKRVGEAMEYFGQAAAVAEKRTWNLEEIERCRELAYRRVDTEFRRRAASYSREELAQLATKARHEVDKFIDEEMR